ncbi:hypothetical protein SDC9_211452 [bioreactor metagenome]|uniref:Uncharacterized protein n=1 Tax=bioreactor metagenome TaxID=1076179 RepID=A0A645JK01_9ZZZZ
MPLQNGIVQTVLLKELATTTLLRRNFQQEVTTTILQLGCANTAGTETQMLHLMVMVRKEIHMSLAL